MSLSEVANESWTRLCVEPTCLKQTPTHISSGAPRETCATCLGKATNDFADRGDQFRVCLRYSRPAVGSLHDRSGTHRQRFRTEGRSI